MSKLTYYLPSLGWYPKFDKMLLQGNKTSERWLLNYRKHREVKILSALGFEHYEDFWLWDLIIPPIFNQFLQIICQNRRCGFFYSPKYNLLIYLTSKPSYSFPNLFTFLGNPKVETILRINVVGYIKFRRQKMSLITHAHITFPKEIKARPNVNYSYLTKCTDRCRILSLVHWFSLSVCCISF